MVVGSDPGSKFDKAQSLGVRILKEDEFDALLEGKLAEEPAARSAEEVRGPCASPVKEKLRARDTFLAKPPGGAADFAGLLAML